jgi:damage-control phosphatase, subfamily I
MDYALRAGIDKLAVLTDTGLAAPGFPMERVRPEVRAMLDSADMVISKGMGNFESLLDVKRRGVFCLLKAKCDLVASLLDVRHSAVLLLECGRFDMRLP